MAKKRMFGVEQGFVGTSVAPGAQPRFAPPQQGAVQVPPTQGSPVAGPVAQPAVLPQDLGPQAAPTAVPPMRERVPPRDDPQRQFKTRVGSGSNQRVDSLKGPFVKDMEQQVHDLASSIVDTTNHLREANGPIPALQEPLSLDRVAALHLPEWFVHGNQHPTSQAAQDYWQRRLEIPNPSSPGAAGPAGANLFQQQMAELWQNPKYRAIALQSMPQDLRDELLQAVQSGDHPGYAVTLKDGAVERIPESGSIDDHLAAAGGVPSPSGDGGDSGTG